tara:strand:- start:552 stop:1967 length:1416 start_codon:yes stop_codon:yes gene_type:complete
MKKIKTFIVKLFIAFFLFIFSFVLSQEIPNEFYNFKINKIYYDNGNNWTKLSTFGPNRFYKSFNKTSQIHDSLNFDFRIGAILKNNNTALYGYENISFKKYFYAYLYARVVDKPNAFPRFTGLPRNIDRSGYVSGETDMSGLGFQNEWLILQMGRGRQSWGAGNDIQLALSENSPSYDYGLLGLSFKNIRFRYFHGFLGSDSLTYNRYITSKGLEYSNLKSFIFSISEITIYSGINRSIDLSYLNPVSSHLEIELNDRQNRLGTKSGNSVWQLCLDWLIIPKLRLSGNFLIDEYVIDKNDNPYYGKSRYAYSSKISYSNDGRKDFIKVFYFSSVYIGPLTFRHGDGKNNFVVRGKPLGWNWGSHTNELKIGVDLLYKLKIISNVEIGHRFVGKNTINSNPYMSHFPFMDDNSVNISDESEGLFFSCHNQWWLKPEFSILCSLEWVNYTNKVDDFIFNIGIDVYLPKRFRSK